MTKFGVVIKYINLKNRRRGAEMSEKDVKGFYDEVNPNDVNSILEKVNEKKLPRAEVKEAIPIKKEEAEGKKEKADSMKTISKTYVPKILRKGDIISVTVVKLEANGVMVNAGGKEDYFISLKNLTAKRINSPEEITKVGDKIDVYVMKTKDAKGNAILSKKKADYVKEWERLKDVFKEGKRIAVKATKATKGGLLVNINGVVGFLPQSHVDLKKVKDLKPFVGKELEVKVLEINPSIRRVIVSRREVLREEQEKERKEALLNIKKGQILNGVVRTIKNFGVFVDIGHGIDGFVPLNELNWGRRKLPREVVRPGEEVRVKVLSVNVDTGKVTLSLKQTKPYPWDVVEEKFPVGSIAEGTVIRIHPFGVVVELDEGITGLVHISQLDTKRVNKVDDVVKIGDKIKVKVLAINKNERKMRLSRRAVLEEQNA